MVIQVSFHDNVVSKEKLQYAVIMAKYNKKWILVRHEKRNTWEIPGGHIEQGEEPMKAASRELYEETGAKEFDLELVCTYSVNIDKGPKSFGQLFYANVHELGELPDSEIEETKLADKVSGLLTYPDIQPLLADRVEEYLMKKGD